LLQSLPDLLFLDLDLPVSRELEILKNLEGRCDVDVVKANPDGSIESLGEPGSAWAPGGIAEWESRLLPGEGGIEIHKVCDPAPDPQKAAGRPNRFGAMVGSSQAMQEVYALISKVAATDVTVMVTGDSGTGKELVAQAIQAFSRRSRKPYLVINCGAISSTLSDSELFGHEQGSFTGANHLHKGHFERACGGTIFLDEITEMPLELQVKLLRVLESGDLMRVGGDQPVSVDVRVIAATNRPLEEALADGKLREDLFYRLNVFPIHLPPLRERQEDLDLLAEHFLFELNKVEATGKKFARPARERLRTYHWPGNVRELKNLIQRAFILAGDKITPDCLPKEVGCKGGSSESILQLKVGTSLAEAERRLILATFDYCEGNKMKTAEVLGISLRTLYNRLEAYSNEPREVESQSA